MIDPSRGILVYTYLIIVTIEDRIQKLHLQFVCLQLIACFVESFVGTLCDATSILKVSFVVKSQEPLNQL